MNFLGIAGCRQAPKTCRQGGKQDCVLPLAVLKFPHLSKPGFAVGTRGEVAPSHLFVDQPASTCKCQTTRRKADGMRKVDDKESQYHEKTCHKALQLHSDYGRATTG